MPGRHGFSLIEVLITIVIIGLLAAVALPQYIRVTERARAGEALEMLSQLRSAERRYKTELEADGKVGVYTGTFFPDLDLTIPAMQSWDAPVYNAAEVDLSVTRKAGIHKTVELRMDVNSGAPCSPNAAAAADWGLATIAADCP